MPRATLPPTPISSTDLIGKTGAQLSSAEMSFVLPPPAIAAAGSKKSIASMDQSTTTSADFSLPPPPTRSRKIIQMKPKAKPTEGSESLPTIRPALKGSAKKGSGSAAAMNAAGKKQPSSTSAAGKKMARKTAHSVIERRRRSKMNEEFNVLKGMIPACKDQEMHKLAILQASIDYLRYLEQCISNLQAVNNSITNTPAHPQPQVPPRLTTSFSPEEVEADESDSDEDQEMANSESATTTPAFSSIDYTAASTRTDCTSTQTSPTLDLRRPASSYASSVSTLPSPAYGPQHTPYQYNPSGYMHSAPMSPMMLPGSNDLDREATDALLMLNKERRNPSCGRGMSVKDLLSS